jgi:LuxR family transcriptional regulator, maltose regulon positive regulatory protein
LNGALAEAISASREASNFGWATRNYLAAINSARNEALAQVAQGRLRAAVETYRHTIAHTRVSTDRPLPVSGIAYVGYAELCYQWNDLDGAEQAVATGLDLGRQGGLTDILVSGGLLLARLHAARGATELAIQVLEQVAPPTMPSDVPQTFQPVHALAALLRLQMGHVDVVRHWAYGYLHAQVDRTAYSYGHQTVVLARVWIAEGNAEEAIRLIAHLLASAEAGGRKGDMIELLVLQALALQSRDDVGGACAALDHALTLAEPEGYVRVFVDEGEPMAALLRQVSGARRSYAQILLEAYKAGLPTNTAVPQPYLRSSTAPLIEPLSEREREVLRLVAAGLSDRAIAERLILAIGTVKKHLNNIYGKLGVHTRTQALMRARELNVF